MSTNVNLIPKANICQGAGVARGYRERLDSVKFKAMKKKKGEAERLDKILSLLVASGLDATPGLAFRSPWQLLVATVLSAQCTDVRVNIVTPGLFRRWPGPGELAAAPLSDVEEEIRSIGLFRNKAKNLISLAGIVAEKHGGVVPGEREALEALPGVGRKTASVVLAMGFGEAAFAVDTHIGRVAMRLGFSPSREPLEVERKVTSILPKECWRDAHLLLILHGRKTCHARKPACTACPVEALCPKKGV